jgi:YD repeat-containing protein
MTYRYYAVTFSVDKTRIDEGVSNGRNIVWLFDAKGRVLSSEVFEKDGRPSGTKAVYKYDAAGQLTSILNYGLGPLSYTETITYPDKKHLRIARVFEHPKDTIIETDEFDAAGNVVKATFEDEDGTQTELYKYDNRGNALEFVGKDPLGKTWITETYQYEFDSYGNWTTRSSETIAREPHSGIPPKSVTTRRLTYY